MKKFKGAIFDMDGTLLDTMSYWRHLAIEYLRDNNIAYPARLEKEIRTMGIDGAVTYLIDNFGLQTPREMIRKGLLDILEKHYRYDAVFKPGTMSLLKKLRERNIPTMVFSATPAYLLEVALKRLGAAEYFSCGLLSCDDVKSSKHHPEAFMRAAEHMGLASDEIIIFEDAWYAATTVKKTDFTLVIMADKEEWHTDEMRELADFYVEKNWDEFPVDDFF